VRLRVFVTRLAGNENGAALSTKHDAPSASQLCSSGACSGGSSCSSCCCGVGAIAVVTTCTSTGTFISDPESGSDVTGTGLNKNEEPLTQNFYKRKRNLKQRAGLGSARREPSKTAVFARVAPLPAPALACWRRPQERVKKAEQNFVPVLPEPHVMRSNTTITRATKCLGDWGLKTLHTSTNDHISYRKPTTDNRHRIAPIGGAKKNCENPPYIQRKCAIWIVSFHEC
jgi:hypothetical protein